MTKTVIEHILTRLQDIGITDIFGVAGDYAFPINDAICKNNTLRWVGNCNELNAAYAADGYARIKGVAALATTFAVGELSALNGIAGAYAERLPIFHLVGMPASHIQHGKYLVHHTLGNGDFEVFYRIAQSLSCAYTIITPENCIDEIERLITHALSERRPVYIGLPADYAKQTIVPQKKVPISLPESCPNTLRKVINLIANRLICSECSCALISSMVSRFELVKDVETIIKVTNLPYATMFMDKGVLNETNSQYMGVYNGRLMNLEVANFVESCECVLNIGALMSDVNTGCFTANLSPENHIQILADHVIIDSVTYPHVYIYELLSELKDILTFIPNNALKAYGLGVPQADETGKITRSYLYPRLEKFFKQNDIIIAETGTFSMGLGFALLPKEVSFQTQSLWGSIGWATPAALGAAIAAPHRRVILATGEGSHQLTVQEISQFARWGLKPIIFVLNNDGYLIERLFCKNPEYVYNDTPHWNYAQLPAAFGCHDWLCKKITLCEELEIALEEIESKGCAAYIEIITDRYESSELLQKMGEIIRAEQ
ncbi:alpha-keto acid decarboxylase family protein [Providencia rustigianii]|uniref:alpha-keto acid decarboxylase family protein n=1 Tax=Providencia rustigianii TaxID=158850 RepID=UPI002240A569|nr:thiamine pyrophosphate-binding protein [Providencia rustigianii]